MTERLTREEFHRPVREHMRAEFIRLNPDLRWPRRAQLQWAGCDEHLVKPPHLTDHALILAMAH